MPTKFQSIAEAVDFLAARFSASAPARFRTYLEQAKNRQLEALCLYRWNLQLSEALCPCLHASEVTLRNAVHRAMCSAYLPEDRLPADGGLQDWWFHAQVGSNPLLHDVQLELVHQATNRVASTYTTVTTDRVVADLGFGFWVSLLDSRYYQTVFPQVLGSTMGKLKHPRTQPELHAAYTKIKKLRNRVMHHEPIVFDGDLTTINHEAWRIATEVDNGFAAQLRAHCRFKAVFDQGPTGYRPQILAQARSLCEYAARD